MQEQLSWETEMSQGTTGIWRLDQGWKIKYQDSSFTWLLAAGLRSLLALAESSLPHSLDLSIGCWRGWQMTPERTRKKLRCLLWPTWGVTIQHFCHILYIRNKHSSCSGEGNQATSWREDYQGMLDTFYNRHKGSFLLSFKMLLSPSKNSQKLSICCLVKQ